MSKISLSISKELLASLDSYCEQFKYERSEAIRQSIRSMIYPKDIPSTPNIVNKPIFMDGEEFTKRYNEIDESVKNGTFKTKENGKMKNREVSVEEMKREVSLDELELQKQEKIKKARESITNIEKNSRAPVFCPKHGTMRVGDHYTCGCLI